ncbi:hypothetical protein F442_02374 [Phytophthora nicotianae P10297]|uniref:Uncharacterized protein n=1 Tax=Phytophthora nicotianae P10297 TaxID=1317064 RepID=W3A083_PHYNI|nr:hypothetical protein F442_02374 [Phytophthora nicotianae P10297]
MEIKTAVADAAPKWVGTATMTLPKELPMEHGSTTSEIYVRDCYPPYYKRIARMMEDRTTGGITITGTPGIGKSVFFRNSEILRKVDSGTDAMMTRACLQAQTEAPSGVFYLYDGPPQVYPRRARMVCFTSQNMEWFRNNTKDENHLELFMPLWSLQELETAADALAL